MSIEVYWDDQDLNLLHWVFNGPWTLEQYWQAHTHKLALIAERQQRFNLYAQLRSGVFTPHGNILSTFARTFDSLSPLIGTLFISWDHPLQRHFFGTYERFYRSIRPHAHLPVVWVSGLDEVRQALATEQMPASLK